MKTGLILLGILITSGVTPAKEEDPEPDSFIEAYSDAWNTHSGDALVVFFTADADLIMGSLPRVAGREAIGKWWDMYFSRIDTNRKGEFRLLSFRDITPDVRIVNVISKTFGANEHGEELETRFARGTWVLVKRNGTWQIAAMRGFPTEGEQRFLPGTDRNNSITDRNKDLVVIHFQSSGTNLRSWHGKPPTGRKVFINEFSILRIEDGKIAEQWLLPDIYNLNIQLGFDN